MQHVGAIVWMVICQLKRATNGPEYLFYAGVRQWADEAIRRGIAWEMCEGGHVRTFSWKLNKQIALKNVVCMWDACDTYKQPKNNKARDRESRHTMYEACVHGLLKSNARDSIQFMEISRKHAYSWCRMGFWSLGAKVDTEKLKAKLVC